MTEEKAEKGCGADVGTGNLVSARQVGKKVITTKIRNAFIDLPIEHKRMLKISKTSFIEQGDKLLVLGDEALDTANLFNREARRPMSGGVISSGELDAQSVVGLMIKKILGKPTCDNEKCCYSIPAPAIDVPDSDVSYHSAIFGKILSELGYSPEPINESLAIIFSECAKENFSGLAISFGAGMANICLAYNAMSALEYSTARAGDWADRGAAKAVGTTAAKICSIKEHDGFNIVNTKNREEEAIGLFLQNLIDYTIKNTIQQFAKVRREIVVPKPVPIIVSGGTSLAGGFLDKFKERFEIHRKDFPVEISEIRAAGSPLMAVATGLLVLSQSEE
jgi:hypothetical protein